MSDDRNPTGIDLAIEDTDYTGVGFFKVNASGQIERVDPRDVFDLPVKEPE